MTRNQRSKSGCENKKSVVKGRKGKPKPSKKQNNKSGAEHACLKDKKSAAPVGPAKPVKRPKYVKASLNTKDSDIVEMQPIPLTELEEKEDSSSPSTGDEVSWPSLPSVELTDDNEDDYDRVPYMKPPTVEEYEARNYKRAKAKRKQTRDTYRKKGVEHLIKSGVRRYFDDAHPPSVDDVDPVLPQVPPPVKTELVCGYDALLAGTHRDFLFVLYFDGAYVWDAPLNFGGTVILHTGFVKYIQVEEEILETSLGGSFYKVNHNRPGNKILRFRETSTPNGMSYYGPEGLVWVMAVNAIETAVSPDLFLERKYAMNSVRSRYRMHYKMPANLQTYLEDVVTSQDFLDLIAYYDDRDTENWYQTAETAVKRAAYLAGSSVTSLLLRTSLELFAPAVAASVIGAGAVLTAGELLGAGEKLALTVGSVAYSIYKLWDPRRQVYNKLKGSHAKSNGWKKASLFETLRGPEPDVHAVTKTCFGELDRTLPPIMDGCSVTFEDDKICIAGEKLDTFGVKCDSEMIFPTSCNHNLNAAIRLRMTHPRLALREKQLNFSRFAKKLLLERLQTISVTEDSFQSWVTGRYSQGRIDELWEGRRAPLGPDGLVSVLFVKQEPYLGKTKADYKPRMIFNRKPEVVGKFGPWFHNFSKQLALKLNKDSDCYYVSGATPEDVGSYAQRMDQKYPYIYELDVSSWDGSLSRQMLLLEKWVLETLVEGSPTHEADYQFLLENWTSVNGYSNDRKVRVSLKHGRRSGDLWTSSMNSLLNYAIVCYVFGFKPGDCRMMVLGDDNLMATDKYMDEAEIVQRYAELGMKVEVKTHTSVEDSSFCSGYFWPVGGRLIWGSKPWKVLAKFGLNVGKHPKSRHDSLRYGTASSMMPVSGHIPVLGSLLRRICELSEGKVKKAKDNRWDNPYRISGAHSYFPCKDTYEAFCERYDVSLEEVLSLEQSFSTLQLTDFPIILKGPLVEQGLSVDLDCGLRSQALSPSFAAMKMDVTSDIVAPVIEEAGKIFLANALGINPLIPACLVGLAEDTQINNGKHVWLHMVFTALSLYWFPLGVLSHVAYNTFCTNQSLFVKGSIINTLWKKPLSYEEVETVNILGIPNDWLVHCKSGKKRKTKIVEVISRKPRKSMAGKRKKKTVVVEKTSVAGDIGAKIGRFIGDGAMGFINKITGMGDYKVQSNSLMNSQTPVFAGAEPFTFRHSEYLADVISSTGFQVTEYPINPGLQSTFPWLSQIAPGFQCYKIKGLIFHYKPMSGSAVASANAALGTVVMATQYDPDASAFVAKRDMETYQFSTSAAPNCAMIHPVECKESYNVLGEKYVRSDEVTNDLRFSDHGTFSIATVGMQTAGFVVGELWVSYHIEMTKPRSSPAEPVNKSWRMFHYGFSSPTTIATPFANYSSDFSYGSLDCSIPAANRYDYPALAGKYYLTVFNWVSSTASTLGGMSISPTECDVINCWDNGSNSDIDNTTDSVTNHFMAIVMHTTGDDPYLTVTSFSCTNCQWWDVMTVEIGGDVDFSMFPALFDWCNAKAQQWGIDPPLLSSVGNQLFRGPPKGDKAWGTS